MRSSVLSALLLGLQSAAAFKDTSPFFLFSTSELLASSQNLISASSLRAQISPQLQTCPSDTYVIVSQPGVNAADFSDRRATPNLRQMVLGDDADIRSSLMVQDVKGTISADGLSSLLQTKCGAGHLRVDASSGSTYPTKRSFVQWNAGSFAIPGEEKPRVINLDFPSLPLGSDRAMKMAEHDAFLRSVLDLLPSTKYTVIYTTTPSDVAATTDKEDSSAYEMESIFQSSTHMELKRDLANHKRASGENVTLPEGPLFERYQFLSPGLFMGILTAVLLLSILYVAISGVSSLQITYAAFDKETGPAKQSKAQ